MGADASNSKIYPSDGQIDRLVVLPFAKSLEIAFKSLRVRFFRSLITTMSLVLAVSFLSFVNISTDAANGILSRGTPAQKEALVKSGYDVGPGDTSVGSSPKQRWIIILSLLVCVVGIVNAQLMAVTERFREIGTMKCLGALDRFVLRLFVLEAAMQGISGALAGVLAGGAFALLSMAVRFGGHVFRHLSPGELLASAGISLAVGFLLSLLGVLYPAFVAARMQPVEAMRVEQ